MPETFINTLQHCVLGDAVKYKQSIFNILSQITVKIKHHQGTLAKWQAPPYEQFTILQYL